MREFGEKAEAFDFLRQTSTATSLESDPSAGTTGPGAGGPARSAAALGRLKRAGTLMKTGSIMGKSSRGLLQSGKEGNSADEAPAAPPVRLSSAMRARQAIAAGLPTSRAIAQILEREFAVGVQSRVTLSSVGRGATNLPAVAERAVKGGGLFSVIMAAAGAKRAATSGPKKPAADARSDLEGGQQIDYLSSEALCQRALVMRADTFGVDAPETQETIDMLLAMYQNQHHERLAEAAELVRSPEDHVARLQDIIGELDQSVDFFLLERSRQAAIRVARDERLKREEAARKRGGAARSKALLLAGAPSCVPAEDVNRFARARTYAMLGLGWQTAMDDEQEAVKREQDEERAQQERRATIAADLAEMGDPDDKSVTELLAEDGSGAVERGGGPLASAAAASTEAPSASAGASGDRLPTSRGINPESLAEGATPWAPDCIRVGGTAWHTSNRLSVHSDTFSALLTAARANAVRAYFGDYQSGPDAADASALRNPSALAWARSRGDDGERHLIRALLERGDWRTAAVGCLEAIKRDPRNVVEGASLTRALRAMREYPRIDDFKARAAISLDCLIPGELRWSVSSPVVIGTPMELRYELEGTRAQADAEFVDEMVQLASEMPPPKDRLAELIFFGFAEPSDDAEDTPMDSVRQRERDLGRAGGLRGWTGGGEELLCF